MTTAYAQSMWSLADLFPSQTSPEMQAALQELEDRVSAFEKHREQLTDEVPVAIFLEMIRQLEQLSRFAYRISGFARLSFAANTQDQAAQTFLAQVNQIMAGVENRTLFFTLWWKELSDAVAGPLMQQAGDYAYWLEEMRHFKPHTLTEAEEKVINIKDVNGATALRNLYDSITNRYSFRITIDGQEKEVTRGELMVLIRHFDPQVRAQAYQELYRVYGDEAPILGQIYQTLVRDWHSEQVDLRRFASPIAARNLANDIPDEVVDTLLQVSEQNAHIFQRFFQLKARLLGMERLRRFDIYAPIAKSEKKYGFAEATDLVLSSFERFDPQLAMLSRRVFDEAHLDSEVRRGKRSGAFCSTVLPDMTPWVLLNFQGRAEDVATMAHELGHAIHAMLASEHSLFTFHASLPLAETASTFGELTLVDRLLQEETDETVRRDLLFAQVDDAYATVMRQVYFALFEKQAHEMIKNGASVDELSAAYLENLKRQFGDAVDVGEEFRWEWVSIPHIYHVPFYVYAYAFGQLLVLSLYQEYKQEGESFKPRYLRILQSGGSQSPAKILKEAGVDIYSAKFWQGGFDVIAGLVDKLAQSPGHKAG